jgi:hypothetical protein
MVIHALVPLGRETTPCVRSTPMALFWNHADHAHVHECSSTECTSKSIGTPNGPSTRPEVSESRRSPRYSTPMICGAQVFQTVGSM